jgi:membrane-associated phospholipid phosphatase
MRPADYVINLVLSGVLIIGSYQFYFWCQRNAPFEARELGSSIDSLIPYVPAWVWVYSFLYYPAILYVNFVLNSPEHFTQVASSYMLLLALQLPVFLLFPVRTPQSWRVPAERRRGLSERYLAFVQKFDAPSNSFPSMHTSIAMLTALHLYDRHGVVTLAFPALIGLSCLFTKQHYLVDIPAGAALGWLAHTLYVAFIAH